MMIKLLLVTLLCGVALGGYAENHGWGWHWSGGDSGNSVGHGHHGWGGWNRPGWATVKLWQDKHSYQYGLKEHGKDYEKYVNVHGDSHHSEPVHHHGWGHQ